MQVVLTSSLLIEAYRQGLFPMAYDRLSPFIQWICPEERGQISIPDMHIPRSLKKDIRRGLREHSYEIKIDHDFASVIENCAEERSERPETWINQQIIDAFIKLHKKGYAHSVEYYEGGVLLGGLYGLSIGGAFFGESMYSKVSGASKIALVHLAARLWHAGYKVLDTQFVNDHLEQFGVYELLHEEYMEVLKPVLDLKCNFKIDDLNEKELIEAYFEMRHQRS